ncbi:uncharacterized protein LOC135827226 [Sycon ciliatum]|uniref:uncharacterized protein LOC135827226 n=1 Tax=Sycon ciliatum TaxID=27933 RepID=UPI0031F5F916
MSQVVTDGPYPPLSPPPVAHDVPLSAAAEVPLAADVPPAAGTVPPAVLGRPPIASAAGPSPDCFKPRSLLALYADPALSKCYIRYDAASGKFVHPPEAVSRPPDCQPPAVTASRPDLLT